MGIVTFDDIYFFADELFHGIVFGPLHPVKPAVSDGIPVIDQNPPGMQFFHNLMHFFHEFEFIQRVREVAIVEDENLLHFGDILDFTITIDKILVEKS